MGAIFKAPKPTNGAAVATATTATATATNELVSQCVPPRSSYILLPVSLMVNFKSFKSTPTRDTPLFDIAVGGVDHSSESKASPNESNLTLALRVCPDQFGAIAAITDSVTNFRKFSKLRVRRPKNSRPKDNPRGWWQYIIHAVILQVRDHLGLRSWIRVTELLKVRREYEKLYRAYIDKPNNKNGN